MSTPRAQRTYTPRAGQYHRAWRVVDAEGKALGRLASEIAGYLRGKHLPTFAEHMDVGDFVVVVNAERLRVTGNKLQQKFYYRHSGYPGGFKAVSLADLLPKHPDRVIKHAVKGMLPHNTLGRKLLKKLKIYVGPTHPHEAQIVSSDRVLAGAPMPVPNARRKAAAAKAAENGGAAPAKRTRGAAATRNKPTETTAAAPAPDTTETAAPTTTSTEEQTA